MASKIVASMVSRMSRNEKRTEEAHERADLHDSKIDDLERRTAALEQAGNASNVFVPKSVEVKGVCDFTERRENGMTRIEAEELVNKLKSGLSPSLQQKVGDIHLRGVKCYKFSVDVAPGFAGDVSGAFKDLLRDSSLHYKGRELYTTVERDGPTQKMFNAAGKAKPFIKTLVPSTATTSCTWEPEWKLIVANEEVNVKVGIVHAGRILWDEDGCKTAFGKSAETMNQALAAFRQ